MLPKKLQDRLRRKNRIRSKVSGTAECPRMSVYRSMTRITVQLIDDTSGKTVLQASTKEAKAKPNSDGAKKLGELIAKKARTKKISEIVFDRNAYAYHGRVKALADAARDGGLKF
ncbi:MAG: 50S ribosomal protein L18 [Candidatus Peribacteraceae bacterium]|jgi:large subunit ribosomal protein L18|nr:50S ribosomal protein L18 [Candidatus Peribacteraceae bacterium]HCI03845.1 50S ribosomal protein L18 [Candidatus Peribacteria bacterium]|tara:strand:+ start:3862 stop:4206 length:345 start_codon:yes stop_codon:yes gene_type:complete